MKIWANIFIMFRNCVAFSFAWLVLLVVLTSAAMQTTVIEVEFLLKIFVFCLLGSTEFTFMFSKELFKRRDFIFRLNGFVVSFIPMEIMVFNWMGIFNTSGKPIQWLLFTGLIVVFYISCLCIDKFVYAKKGDMYTQQLIKYQESRKEV